ncbi:MAG TPA: type I restriction enzyme endonuclease domain-containing protein [Gemmatimonadales bacterium]|nr:type I restriction enzyme endonuclease domain-containing protein [Gemmatimonadales bacterium]
MSVAALSVTALSVTAAARPGTGRGADPAHPRGRHAGGGLGDDALRTIARELVATLRKNVTIDWAVRENVRAQLCVLVKRILRKYGYPPDKQEKATLTVLEQAEVLSAIWAA